jgi:hypothetical protein
MIKANLCYLFASILALALLARPASAAVANTNSSPRLTVELRDGSRVIGTSVGNQFKFHSTLFGDLTLDVAGIRSVDCVATNSAKLTAANGDSLTVAFADAAFAVNTSFGKVELPVESVRRFSVSAAGLTGTHPAGLVALWSGEGDGKDAIGHHDAELMNIGFEDGQVGQAFAFNGLNSWMKISAGPALDVGQGEGLTLAVWIKPSNVTLFRPILEWNSTAKLGVHLWLNHLSQQHGELFGNLVDAEGNSHSLHSAEGVIVPEKFQQVTLTYDKVSGTARLWVNGVVVAQENLGRFTPQTAYDLLVSRRPGDHPGDWTYNAFFAGLLDEIALYNRALSAEEIQSLCLGDNHGERPMPSAGTPAISLLPANGAGRNGSGE